MPLFREPPMPPKPNETMGERVARQAQQRVPPPPGRGYAMLALGALVLGGVLYTLVTGGGAVTKTMRSAREQVERDQAKEEADKAASGQPRADGLPTAPGVPAPQGGPTPATGRPYEITVPPPAAPGPDTAATTEPGAAAGAPDATGPEIPLSDFAAAVRVAPPEMRPAIRRHGLEAFAKAVGEPRARRAVLLEAARWGPDAVPEEADLFAKITDVAISQGLPSPTDAAAALIYLGSLRDRGGVIAVIAVEKVVLDESRPLELRVAAARILPSDARPKIVKEIAARPGPHPALLSALK